MIFEAGEPEYLRRRPMIFPIIVGAASGLNVATGSLCSADDAPGQEATKALVHATIHPAVTGAAARTSVGAYGAADWANLIAVN
jgi:hypothetical protein